MEDGGAIKKEGTHGIVGVWWAVDDGPLCPGTKPSLVYWEDEISTFRSF